MTLLKPADDKNIVSIGDKVDLLVMVGQSDEGGVLPGCKKAAATWISLLNTCQVLQIEDRPVGGDEGQVCKIKILGQSGRSVLAQDPV